jgi:hypothetical protein
MTGRRILQEPLHIPDHLLDQPLQTPFFDVRVGSSSIPVTTLLSAF